MAVDKMVDTVSVRAIPIGKFKCLLQLAVTIARKTLTWSGIPIFTEKSSKKIKNAAQQLILKYLTMTADTTNIEEMKNKGVCHHMVQTHTKNTRRISQIHISWKKKTKV
jgi:hypothetical protein